MKNRIKWIRVEPEYKEQKELIPYNEQQMMLKVPEIKEHPLWQNK